MALLPRTPFIEVRRLTRRAAAASGAGPGVHEVGGNLLEPERYRGALPEGGTVVHLAGAVGKQRPHEFQRQNVEGTRRLLGAAAEAGVAHFVFVSSIAATGPDLRRYPYGASKRDAEQVVRDGPIPWTILRPTMVFGTGSPNQSSLERLALLPWPLLFGRGTVRVQPIHVDDLARVILDAAAARWPCETVDVGGPEVLTLNELFQRMRHARGHPSRAPLHLPLVPIRAALTVAEPIIWSLLPFTSGQLSAFQYDSCAAPSNRMESVIATLRGVDAMLEPGTREPAHVA